MIDKEKLPCRLVKVELTKPAMAMMNAMVNFAVAAVELARWKVALVV